MVLYDFFFFLIDLEDEKELSPPTSTLLSMNYVSLNDCSHRNTPFLKRETTNRENLGIRLLQRKVSNFTCITLGNFFLQLRIV